jgi:DNA-binding MarR family transcriptional regulator
MTDPPADHAAEVMAQWRRERPDLDVAPQGLIGRLHRLAAALYEELDTVYARFGVSDGEFDVLATLRRAGEPFELTPTQLAASTMVTSGAVSKRLDRLEAAGLVRRERSATDGRGRVVGLTSAGRELIDEAFTAHIANEHRLLEGLDAHDRAELERLLVTWSGHVGA